MPSRIVSKPKKYIRRPRVSRSLPRSQPRRVVRGRGDYYLGGSLSAGASLGKLGYASGSLHGGYSKGNAIIPQLSGRGDYAGGVMRGDPPVIQNSRLKHPGATVVRHREYIQTMVSSSTSGAFKVDAFPLNPGMAQTFPWLSTVASNYSEYELVGMLVELKSICSEAISSASLATIGEVAVATNYNSLDPAYTSFQQMANSEFAQCGRASDKCIMHMVECDPKQVAVSPRLYVRSGALASGADIRLYDHGTLYVASNNIVGTSVSYAELWITYEICLRLPKIANTPSGAGANIFKWYGPNVATNQPITGTGVTQYYPQNNMPVTLTQTGIVFPTSPSPTSYLVQLNWSGYTAIAAAFNTMTFTNCYRVKVWANNTSIGDASPQAGLAGTTQSSYSLVVTTSGVGIPSMNLGNNVVYAGTGYVEGIISEVAFFDPAIYGYA